MRQATSLPGHGESRILDGKCRFVNRISLQTSPVFRIPAQRLDAWK